MRKTSTRPLGVDYNPMVNAGMVTVVIDPSFDHDDFLSASKDTWRYSEMDTRLPAEKVGRLPGEFVLMRQEVLSPIPDAGALSYLAGLTFLYPGAFRVLFARMVNSQLRGQDGPLCLDGGENNFFVSGSKVTAQHNGGKNPWSVFVYKQGEEDVAKGSLVFSLSKLSPFPEKHRW